MFLSFCSSCPVSEVADPSFLPSACKEILSVLHFLFLYHYHTHRLKRRLLLNDVGGAVIRPKYTSAIHGVQFHGPVPVEILQVPPTLASVATRHLCAITQP